MRGTDQAREQNNRQLHRRPPNIRRSDFVTARGTCKLLCSCSGLPKCRANVRKSRKAHRKWNRKWIFVSFVTSLGIVQAGSVTRAADQLHVAQSALSHHLASLEAELNRQLVTRGPKGIQLTEAGRVLYRHAEAILRHVEFAKQDAMCALNVPSGRVSIGFPLVLAALLSYETFARVRSAYPQIVLHITDASYAVVRERLINGRLDMALLFVEQPECALTIEPLLYEELLCVTAKPNTLPITLADAARQPLLAAGLTATVGVSPRKRSRNTVWTSHGLARSIH